jgi:hypothetical protein
MRRRRQDRTMKEMVARLAHIDIYRLLQRRTRKGSGKHITLDALLKKENRSV